MLPAGTDPSRCMGRGWAYRLWRRAEALAGLERKGGRGWHSLRRKFATDLMDLPLKVLCDLGGWKNAHTGAQMLSESRRGTTQEGSGEPPAGFAAEIPIGGNQTAGTGPTDPVSDTVTNRFQI